MDKLWTEIAPDRVINHKILIRFVIVNRPDIFDGESLGFRFENNNINMLYSVFV